MLTRNLSHDIFVLPFAHVSRKAGKTPIPGVDGLLTIHAGEWSHYCETKGTLIVQAKDFFLIRIPRSPDGQLLVCNLLKYYDAHGIGVEVSPEEAGGNAGWCPIHSLSPNTGYVAGDNIPSGVITDEHIDNCQDNVYILVRSTAQEHGSQILECFSRIAKEFGVMVENAQNIPPLEQMGLNFPENEVHTWASIATSEIRDLSFVMALVKGTNFVVKNQQSIIPIGMHVISSIEGNPRSFYFKDKEEKARILKESNKRLWETIKDKIHLLPPKQQQKIRDQLLG